MKKQFVKFALALSIFLGSSQLSHAQRIYVKVQPIAPVVVKPAPIHAGWVWVEGDWVVTNHAYNWRPGYYAEPRRGYVWVSGHWANHRRGSYWIPGHWARV